jgi:WD40-like Beta Propeller Repeat
MYIPGPVSASGGPFGIALMDRKGEVKTLNLPPGPYSSPRVSPDGTRIAFGIDDGKEAIIYTYELSGGTGMKKVTRGGKNQFPVWLDAKRIAFQSDRDGAPAIFWQPVDGGDAVPLMKPQPGESHAPESWSRRPTGFCSASRRDPTCRCGHTRYRIERRRRSARFTHPVPPARCFRRMDDGWHSPIRNGARRRSTSSHSRLQASSMSFQRKGPTFRMQSCGHRTEGNCFTTQGTADSRQSLSPRSRGSASAVPWRCRDRRRSF